MLWLSLMSFVNKKKWRWQSKWKLNNLKSLKLIKWKILKIYWIFWGWQIIWLIYVWQFIVIYMYLNNTEQLALQIKSRRCKLRLKFYSALEDVYDFHSFATAKGSLPSMPLLRYVNWSITTIVKGLTDTFIALILIFRIG